MTETNGKPNSSKPAKRRPLQAKTTAKENGEQCWRTRLMTEIRLRRMTYDQLAEKMGVSQPQVAKHMQGKAKHYHAFVEDACRVLDISTVWIFEGIHPGDVSAPLYDEERIRCWLLNDAFIGEREPVREYFMCPRQFKPGRRTFSFRVPCSDMDDGLGTSLSLPEGEIVFCDPDRPVHSSQSPVVLSLLDGGVLLRQWRRVGLSDLMVPLNRVYPAVDVSSLSVQLSCVVIGGLRSMHSDV